MKKKTNKNIFIKKELSLFLSTLWNEKILIIFIFVFCFGISSIKLLPQFKEQKMFAEIYKTEFSIYRPYAIYYFENDLLQKEIDRNLIHYTYSDLESYSSVLENNFIADFETSLRSTDQFISFLKQLDDYQKISIKKNFDLNKYYSKFKILKVSNGDKEKFKYQIVKLKGPNDLYLYSQYIKFIYKKNKEKYDDALKKVIRNVQISYENEIVYNKKIIQDYANENEIAGKKIFAFNKIILIKERIKDAKKNFFLLSNNKSEDNLKIEVHEQIPSSVFNILDIIRILIISSLTSLIVILIKKNFKNFFKF